MAALGGDTVTLVDWTKRVDPDGAHAMIAELMHETNEIIGDIPLMEANQPTSHRTTQRAGLPTASWVNFNERGSASKSETVQVTDEIGMLESWSQIDRRIADLNGNTPAFRAGEDTAHIEAMSQEVAETLFYGNVTTAPKEFHGLAPRYANPAGTYADNIIDHGGSGNDMTSIWLVVWGPQTIYGVYPKGQSPGGSAAGMNEDGTPQNIAGLTIEDEGLVTSETTAGLLKVYRTHYAMQMGLVVKDWRYAVRIGSIDAPDLATLSNTDELVVSMIRAAERIPSFSMGNAVWYVNRTVREALRLGILEKISSNLTWEDVAGKRVMMFDGIPVHRCDQILNTEAAI